MNWNAGPLLSNNIVFKAQFWFVGSGRKKEEKEKKL